MGTGCLELSPIPLHQQIIDFSRRAGATGVKTIRVVPVFLLKGGACGRRYSEGNSPGSAGPAGISH